MQSKIQCSPPEKMFFSTSPFQKKFIDGQNNRHSRCRNWSPPSVAGEARYSSRRLTRSNLTSRQQAEKLSIQLLPKKKKRVGGFPSSTTDTYVCNRCFMRLNHGGG